MKRGAVDTKEMMSRLKQRIQEKLEEPKRRVEDFEAPDWKHSINQNVMGVVRFYSGSVKFSIGRLERHARMIRQHHTQQRMLMKRGMATSRIYMSRDVMKIWPEE